MDLRFQVSSKILRDERDLEAYRVKLRRIKCTLVVTNGCFDLLHMGHVKFLQLAASMGDALLVGINGDDSVRSLKGPTRPVNPEFDRAEVLAGLACVTAVFIFPAVRAANFLRRAEPDVYVKGEDYTRETLDPDERQALEACGARIFFLPLVGGRSTTLMAETLAKGKPAP